LPILSIEKTYYNFTEEKTLDFKLLNSLGQEMRNSNAHLFYSIDKDQEVKKTEKPKKDSLDLEDDEDEKEKTDDSNLNKLFTNNTNISLEMDKIITKPQIYKLNINAKISTTNNNLNHNYDLNYKFDINAFSKVKINYIKMSVSDTNEKNDLKENTIEYPKRSFKNIKATQKSVIRLKVNVIYYKI
jgi:hypothetical protein